MFSGIEAKTQKACCKSYLKNIQYHIPQMMKKMDKKYITFYKKFILQTKTLNDGGVSSNSELRILINVKKN